MVRSTNTGLTKVVTKTELPKEVEATMRAFANLIIDKVLEDQRNGKLKFQDRSAKIKVKV